MQEKQLLEPREKQIEEKAREIQKIWVKAKTKRELKNLTIFLGLLGLASGGRIALQAVPSVEPIIPIAILTALIFGAKEGFMLGGSAYIISNFFVWGLQGPWTIFQAVGAAVPGATAGIWGKLRKPTWKDLVVLSVLGTIFFEIVMNISGAIMGIGLLGFFSIFAFPLYFALSLPFSIVHIGSNAVFARALSPLLKLRRKKDELKIISLTRVSGSGSTRLKFFKSNSEQ